MTGSGVLTLLRQAHQALPNGTAQERTAWIQQQRRLMEQSPYPAKPEPLQRGPKAFSQLADTPAAANSRKVWDGN